MNIIIVTGRSRNIGNFYDNIINPIKGYFKDKNINFETIHFADQVRKDENPNNLYIGIFHHVDLHNMPKNYIMLAIDPPIVPLFLTCGSPIPSAYIAKDGIDFFTSLEDATVEWVVADPIFKNLLETFILLSPLIFLIFIRSEYAANLSLIAGSNVIPPAKNVDLGENNFIASFIFVAVLKLKLFII